MPLVQTMSSYSGCSYGDNGLESVARKGSTANIKQEKQPQKTEH